MIKQIAIWGSLHYANIGDDMQAIALAQHIKKFGYQVKVFQLEESLSLAYGIESSPDLDSLLKNVELCFIAGGALLTPFRWYRRILDSQAHQNEMDFKDLYLASQSKTDILFCPISIGGDGKEKNPHTWYSKWRNKFFCSPAFLNGTVRLEGDVDQMKSAFNKDFIYHADMLFRIKDYFYPKMLPKTKKKRICLQLKRRHVDKKLLNDIYSYAKEHDNIEFHFITTHLPSAGMTYQYLPSQESKNIFINTYQNPNQLLGVIASCDVIISSMLHVGLMGIVLGTPFLSYRGPGKAHSFLNSIGGDWSILNPQIEFGQLLSKYLLMEKKQLFSCYDTLRINFMMDDSVNHYEFCTKTINEKYTIH